MENTKTRQRLASPLWTIFFVALILVIAGVVAYSRQGIEDWWRLRNYTAPPAIASLASDDTMTPYAQKVFYVNKPQLEGKKAFAANCPSGTEQTVVLGCYHSDQSGIFLLKVTDSRLQGIEQVTAAHETLHAIYERLSGSERQHVDGLLQNYYKHGLHNKTIRDQIESYKKTEPRDITNEMDSIFGTEVSKLPSALENYYSKYFTNRAKIAGYYNNYQAAFTERQSQIKQDDAKLSDQKTTIDGLNKKLQSKDQALTTQRQQLASQKSNGQINDYNSGVASYNSSVNSYNADVVKLKSQIGQYNNLVDKRNALALEEQQLTQEITSQPHKIQQ